MAARNLRRGYTLQLPSGQAVARELGVEPLSNEELGLASFIDRFYEESDHDRPESVEAPLWYYVLAEARIEENGDRLGPVGSRIVAGTLIGLLDADPTSYRQQSDWEPVLVSEATDTPAGEFRIDDVVADGPLRIGSAPPRTLVIQGADEHQEYEVSVSGEIEQVDGTLEGIPVSDNPDDEITGSTATGAVVGGADGFRFSGDVTAFSVTDPETVTVYVDGNSRSPGSVDEGDGGDGNGDSDRHRDGGGGDRDEGSDVRER